MDRTSASVLNFLSFNVRGLSNLKKRKTIFTFCKKQKCDVIFLQETHSTKNVEETWKKEWGGKIIYSHGASNARGAMILLRNSLDLEIEKTITDSSGRLVILRCSHEDKPLTLVNVYAPNDVRRSVDFFEKINLMFSREGIDENTTIIMGGDFNCPLDPNMDRFSKQGNSVFTKYNVLNGIKNIIEHLNLNDIWRTKNPTTRSFTWMHIGKFQYSRIDYWLISNSLQDSVQQVDITPSIKSDHDAINLSLNFLKDEGKGPGLWKLNVTLLNDVEYVAVIEKLIKETLDSKVTFDKDSTSWEWLKYKIRLESIKFSKQKAIKRRDREKELSLKIKSLEEELTKQNHTDDIQSKLMEAKKQLEDVYDEKMKGIIFRSKVKWFEEGEKSSKYFLNLEKRNNIRKTIGKIKLNGNILTDSPSILKAQKDFYQKLYSNKMVNSNEANIIHFLNDIDIPTLSNDQRENCEGELTIEECKNSLDSLCNGKTPGIDGLPAEFYKTFWHLIGPPLLDTLNSSYRQSNLTMTQKQAVITLVEKKGKDRTDLQNWRPISLLNTDLKIASKAIANRVKTVLPSIIHPSQTGYVNDRYIGEMVRLIEDVMTYTKDNHDPGLLLFLDFEKAFDSIDFNFLSNTLKLFGFGPSIRKWLETFYTDITSCILNRGFTSEHFQIQTGVRQGDPLSPYLFILGIEILSIAIRNNKNIHGIPINNQEIKIGLFADDTTVFLSDIESANEVFNIFNDFEKISGLKINTHKSEGMWIGSLRDCSNKPLGIKWVSIAKVLGIYFSYNDKEREDMNFQKRIVLMENILKLWRQRQLSLLGKILVLKSLIYSLFNYVTTMIYVPDYILSKIKTMFFQYLWKGPDKIKRDIVCNDYDEGGLKMLDIDCMIKATKLTWISRYLSPQNKPWKEYLNSCLEKFGGKLIFNCNFHAKDLNFSSPFYEQIFRFWEEVKPYNPAVSSSAQIIWNNYNIKIDDKMVFYSDFHRMGIYLPQHLQLQEPSFQSFKRWCLKGMKRGDILKWYGLRTAIKSNEFDRSGICSTNSNIDIDKTQLEYKGSYYSVQNFKSKQYYVILRQTKQKALGTIFKVMKDFQIQSDEHIKQYFLLPRLVTKEAYLRVFQFQVLHYLINTNVLLKKKNIIDSDVCNLCSKEQQNLYHLFYHCTLITKFWNDFQIFWMNKTKSKVTLTMKDIILGNLQYPHLLNFFLILAKRFIVTCRNNNVCPKIQDFKCILREKFLLEKHVAEKNESLVAFNKRWTFHPI